MSYKYNKRSTKNVNTCRNEIILLFHEVLKEKDHSVICGHRGRKEQEEAFNNGFSKAHFGQSKHNSLPSNAADVLPYPFNGWDDIEQFEILAEVVKRKAKELGINIKWGGDFKNFKDYPHWELC